MKPGDVINFGGEFGYRWLIKDSEGFFYCDEKAPVSNHQGSNIIVAVTPDNEFMLLISVDDIGWLALRVSYYKIDD